MQRDRELTEKVQVYYRGSIKSCNYSCGYCPFSKREMTREQRQKDMEELFRFTAYLEAKKVKNCAVQIVPYGEVLIYAHYWEALARLSRQEGIEAVGCQTNLSFPMDDTKDWLRYYRSSGGDVAKLRLWCTFHPSMTTLETFLSQCRKLSGYKVSYCVGAVGAPGNTGLLQELKASLPKGVYLWINRMDGLKRSYTKEEKKAFQEIDAYFPLELKHKKADIGKCRKSLFVEADGKVSFCNIGRNGILPGNADGTPSQETGGKERALANFYDMDLDFLRLKKGSYTCKRKECSCYLSYCNRNDLEELLPFQPYPAFRIPAGEGAGR